MNNENMMNNENVEVAVEAVKASAGEKIGAIAIVVFAVIGVGFAASKAAAFGKQTAAKIRSKKPADSVEAAVSDIADAIEGKFEEVKESLEK